MVDPLEVEKILLLNPIDKALALSHQFWSYFASKQSVLSHIVLRS